MKYAATIARSDTVRQTHLCGKIPVWIGSGMLAAFLVFRIAWLPRFAVHVDDFVPFAEALRQGINPFYTAEVVELSSFYTYPPGQFIFSLPLASLGRNFIEALWLYRLPSLVFWVTGLLGLYKACRWIWPLQPRSTTLLPLACAIFSWRGFIESSQGYNYATTTLVAVITAVWAIAAASGERWIARGWRAVVAGLILGALTWFTYQAVFVVFAGFLTAGLALLFRKEWRHLVGIAVTGFSFLLPFGAVYLLCLKPVLAFASGTPAWAGGLPEGGGLNPLLFPIWAWRDVLQNNLTFVPWGPGSLVIALAFVAAFAIALTMAHVRRDLQPREKALLLFLFCLAGIFTAGPYLKLFPLGATRHTYVLQAPILLALCFASTRLTSSLRYSGFVGFLIAVTWLCYLPRLLHATRNHVDYGLISEAFSAGPDSRIADLPGAFTWEITFLAREDRARLERIRWFLQFNDSESLARWLLKSRRSLLVSHRAGMSADMRAALVKAGATEITTLAEKAPGQGTELKGTPNGGNGFFLYLVQR